MINPKFQSFRSNYENVKALTSNSKELDQAVLGKVTDINRFIKEAEFIKKNLSDEIIEQAFKQYPPEIFSIIGAEHIDILKSRRDQLPKAAKTFYEVYNKTD